MTQTADSVLEGTQDVLDGLGSEDPLGGVLDETGDLLTTTVHGVEDILEINEGSQSFNVFLVFSQSIPKIIHS